MNSMNRVSAGAALFGVTEVMAPVDLAMVSLPTKTWVLPEFDAAGLSEVEVLRELVRLLKASLRKPDPDDGVMPPRIMNRHRIMRVRKHRSALEGWEPDGPERINMRIALVLLVQYDGRMTRRNACKCLSEAYDALRWKTLENTLYNYGTISEMDYKPYKPGLRVTYRQVTAELKPQGIALAEEELFLPGEYAVMTEVHTFRCERFAEHPHWEAELKYVRYWKQRCPRCRELKLLV